MLKNNNNYHHQYHQFNFNFDTSNINHFVKFTKFTSNNNNNHKSNSSNIYHHHHHRMNNNNRKRLLPPEILLEIFKYIENDKYSLCYCLLVNKEWFELVAPLLWRQPFVLLNNSSNNSHKNNYNHDNSRDSKNRSNLINTYISCSSNRLKLHLINRIGINFNNKLTRPFLNYSTYLRDLDLEDLENSVSCWLQELEQEYNYYYYYDEGLEEKVSFVTSEICKMLFVNSRGLWSFGLGSWKAPFAIPNLSSLSSSSPPSLLIFKNLKKLEIKGDFDDLNGVYLENLINTLNVLISSTKNIEYINIDVDVDIIGDVYSNLFNDKLRRLIEIQTKLKYFKYTRTNCGGDTLSDEYIDSCSTQSESLKRLAFDAIALSEDSILPLIKCKNLDLLQFSNCHQKNKRKIDDGGNGSEEDCNSKLSAPYLRNNNSSSSNNNNNNNNNNQIKVKKLKFLNSRLNNVITTILPLVNCNLSELTLDNPTEIHLEIINRHCTNLTYLALSTTSDILISSSTLLSPTKLRHLILNLKNGSTKMTKQHLIQLGENLPFSLNTLHLHSVFSYDDLEHLLKDFHPNIKTLIITLDQLHNNDNNSNRNSIEGITTADGGEGLLGEGEIIRNKSHERDSQCYFDNYLKVVMNYAKTRNLNEFGYRIINPKDQTSTSPEMIFSKQLLNDTKLLIQNMGSISPFDDNEILCD